MDVPRHQRSTLDRRAFSVAGPIVWNSLPDELRVWETTWKTLGSHWNHCFSVSTSVPSALEVYLYTTMRYINRRFTYLLTYIHSLNFGEVRSANSWDEPSGFNPLSWCYFTMISRLQRKESRMKQMVKS